MKLIAIVRLLFIFCTAVPAFAANHSDTTQIEIPFATAAYFNDSAKSVNVYFFVAHPGRLEVGIKIKEAENTTLHVSLDGLQGNSRSVTIENAKENVVAAGSFEVKDTGYHFISIQGPSFSRRYLRGKSLVLSGDAAVGVKFNNSAYRGAPATHLNYLSPKDTAVQAFYCEIKVPKEAQPLYSYYMTNGFMGGYMGIQINSPTERRILFSIWSDYKTDNPNEIPADYAVTLVRKGENVHSGNFGNEGSGGQTYLQFNWKAETVYKLLVTAKADGDNTVYAGYFFAPEASQWQLIGEWHKRKTGGKLLSRLHSFVENYNDNGDNLFKAYYGNQWIQTTSGNWIELTQSRFSTTADPVKHPRFDYGGGAENDWFYMFSGGFKNAGHTKFGDAYTRKPNGVPPHIGKLP